MRKLLSLGIVILVFATTSISMSAQVKGAHQSGDRNVEGRLVGAWRLVSLEQPGPDGKVQIADCTGLFVFSASGQVSVQVMYRNQRGSNDYAQGGYEASFGRYKIDDSRTFTFHVDGALVRTLIGKDLKRVYELSGNQLTVTSADPSEHWRVVWERY
jgi:hypothetical protein